MEIKLNTNANNDNLNKNNITIQLTDKQFKKYITLTKKTTSNT